MPYQAEVSGWHDFYLLAGTASATLVGLLFVGLSLHLRIVVSTVIPEGAFAAGSQLIGAGIVSLIVAAPSLVGAVRSREWTFEMSPMQRLRVTLRLGLSGVSYVAIIVAGALLVASLTAAFTLLLITTLILLVVSLRNTWDLLVTVADVTQ